MALQASDLVAYESSLGAAPDDETSTIGGTIETGSPVDNLVDEVFETLTSNEIGGGDKTRYAKVFYRNNNVGSPLYQRPGDAGPTFFIDTTEPLGHSWELGLGTDSDTTTQGTAPVGVTFYPQNGEIGSGVIMSGPLGAGSAQALWVKVTLAEGTDPGEVTSDFTISGATGSP